MFGESMHSALPKAARMARFGIVLWPALLAVGCGPSEDPSTLTCGAGTENRNGTCVAIVDPVSSCGEGTTFNDVTGKCDPTIRCGEGTVPHESGECVPEARCGPGTELDLSTGECIPTAACGPGTVLNEVTGECRSEAECGAGTVLQDGACVAVGVCAPGSVLNLDNGLCESHIECGPGQVVAGGQCVNPNVAVGLEADYVESTPDNNDPLYGGTPEAIALSPVGEQTVFVGNIGRPADLADNGTLAQDRDVWRFNGTAGQYLRISVLGTGLPQPAFILDGPRGYRRFSALLSTNNTAREVVLPYDGEYNLTIVPTAYISTNLPVGGLNAGYVGVIEELEKPTPATVVPAPNQESPLTVTGNLRDLSDNFLLLDAEVGTAVYLVFRDPKATTPPGVLAFDGEGKLITHVDLTLSAGAWVGTLVKDELGTTVVVDWQSSTALDDAYTLEVAAVPHQQGGLVPVDGEGSTGKAPIPGFGMAAYTVTVPSPVILFWDMADTSGPDLQVQNDDGTFLIINDTKASFFFADPSTYTFFVHNDQTAARAGAQLVYETVTPHDFGPLDPENPTVESISGHLLSLDFLGPNSAWFVARPTSEALLRFVPSVEIGKPVLSIYDLAGTKLHDRYNLQWERPVHARSDGSPVLVQLASSGVSTLGWELSASALPLPGRLDAEPNDVPSTAVDLGSLPAAAIGSLADTEIDMFKFTIDEPIEPGQAVSIYVESLEATGSSFTSSSVKIFVYDGLDQQVPTTNLYFGHQHLEVFLSPADTQASSTFYVAVQEEFMNGTQDYLLWVDIADRPTENEPNDTRETADPAPSLPYSWSAQWSAVESDPADWFSFTLDEPLGLDEVLRIRMHNMSDNNTTTVELQDAAGNIIATSTSPQAELSFVLLPAGEYFIRFVRGFNYAISYRIEVEIIPLPPTELEPNDAANLASALGALADEPLFAFGYTTQSDPDWFSFTLDEALEDEGVIVRCLNVTDDTVLVCELYDLSDPANPTLLGYAREDEAVILGSHASSTAFGVRVIGTASAQDFYYLQVERGFAAELEPNNTAAEAQPLGLLALGDVLTEVGNTYTADDDWFSFELAPGFDDEDAIWVTFRNITDTTALLVALFDVTDPDNPVELSLMQGQAGTLVSAPSGGSTYAVRVRGTSATSNDAYAIWVETGPRAELEPNDTGATANDLGSLPAAIYGVVGGGSIDVFSFTLDADLSPTEVVEVSFQNVQDTSSYSVSLRPAGDTSRPRQISGASGVMHSELGLAAGTYELQVDGLGTGSTSYSTSTDLYLLEVRIFDTQFTP